MRYLLSIGWVVLLTVPMKNMAKVREGKPGRVDMAVVLDVAAATLMSGSSLPDTLRVLSMSMAGMRVGAGAYSADQLTGVANMLVMGASWEEAWCEVEGFDLLARTLQPAWVDGVAPVALLERAARTLRLTQARRAKESAGRLGAALVMPLGLCFLPAFVIVGVVPVVASFATSLW
ncbi:type II secretion system F family protein [Arcanobacterium phocisimile]|uniref:Type II secretion system F family protein n=1 Tax=Arcanobacterium phocisimile TaxID=1302235 RepID=A0ABX7IGJ2_9ACTO|nr:type II secretion system F family protein [Arcanobacterium phocisimile]QRV02086.1 type II secretion system F family protein [Arcanobacterium phocisimile]